MATDINALTQFLSAFQGAGQAPQTQKSKGMSSTEFYNMWYGDDTDTYSDWEEGDDVYWSDSGGDDSFWNYIDQKVAAKQASQTSGIEGVLLQLLSLLGTDPEQLTEMLRNDESLNLQG